MKGDLVRQSSALIRCGAMALMAALSLLLQGCAVLVDRDKSASVAEVAQPGTDLRRIADQIDMAADESVFRPMPLSDYAMDARLTLIQHASSSIDVQYYLVGSDATGHTLLRALRDAARRGVRVRLLVDDLYTPAIERLLREFAGFDNVQVRVFNPFPSARHSEVTRWMLSLTDVGRLNHRMHNKLFVVDGAFAVAGGRNMADEYFFRSKEGNFIDFDLLLAGAAVSDLEKAFDLYWNSRRTFVLRDLDDDHEVDGNAAFDRITSDAAGAFVTPKETDRDLLGYATLSTELGRRPVDMLRGKIRVVVDDPEKVSGLAEAGNDATTVTSNVVKVIGDARESVLLASPYFVPGATAMGELKRVREHGATVTAVTNSMASNDEPLVSAAYARYRKDMLAMGIKIYEISPQVIREQTALVQAFGKATGRLHAKAIVVDGRTTFVSSMNLDFRSSRENTEIGLFVDSPELAADVTELLDQVRAIGTYRLRLSGDDRHVEWVDTESTGETVYDSEPEADWTTKLKMFLLSPFVSEKLL